MKPHTSVEQKLTSLVMLSPQGQRVPIKNSTGEVQSHVRRWKYGNAAEHAVQAKVHAMPRD